MWYYGSVGVTTSYPHGTWMLMVVFIGESVQSARSVHWCWSVWSFCSCTTWWSALKCSTRPLLRGVGQCLTNLVSVFWVGSKLSGALRSQSKNLLFCFLGFFCVCVLFFFFKADTKLSWRWQYLSAHRYCIDSDLNVRKGYHPGYSRKLHSTFCDKANHFHLADWPD